MQSYSTSLSNETAGESSLLLNNFWTVWYSKYNTEFKARGLGEISSVQRFWHWLKFVDGNLEPLVAEQACLSIFKTGIEPFGQSPGECQIKIILGSLCVHLKVFVSDLIIKVMMFLACANSTFEHYTRGVYFSFSIENNITCTVSYSERMLDNEGALDSVLEELAECLGIATSDMRNFCAISRRPSGAEQPPAQSEECYELPAYVTSSEDILDAQDKGSLQNGTKSEESRDLSPTSRRRSAIALLGLREELLMAKQQKRNARRLAKISEGISHSDTSKDLSECTDISDALRGRSNSKDSSYGPYLSDAGLSMRSRSNSKDSDADPFDCTLTKLDNSMAQPWGASSPEYWPADSDALESASLDCVNTTVTSGETFVDYRQADSMAHGGASLDSFSLKQPALDQQMLDISPSASEVSSLRASPKPMERPSILPVESRSLSCSVANPVNEHATEHDTSKPNPQAVGRRLPLNTNAHYAPFARMAKMSLLGPTADDEEKEYFSSMMASDNVPRYLSQSREAEPDSPLHLSLDRSSIDHGTLDGLGQLLDENHLPQSNGVWEGGRSDQPLEPSPPPQAAQPPLPPSPHPSLPRQLQGMPPEQHQREYPHQREHLQHGFQIYQHLQQPQQQQLPQELSQQPPQEPPQPPSTQPSQRQPRQPWPPRQQQQHQYFMQPPPPQDYGLSLPCTPPLGQQQFVNSSNGMLPPQPSSTWHGAAPAPPYQQPSMQLDSARHQCRGPPQQHGFWSHASSSEDFSQAMPGNSSMSSSPWLSAPGPQQVLGQPPVPPPAAGHSKGARHCSRQSQGHMPSMPPNHHNQMPPQPPGDSKRSLSSQSMDFPSTGGSLEPYGNNSCNGKGGYGGNGSSTRGGNAMCSSLDGHLGLAADTGASISRHGGNGSGYGGGGGCGSAHNASNSSISGSGGSQGFLGTGMLGSGLYQDQPPPASSASSLEAQQRAQLELSQAFGRWAQPERVTCNLELKRLQSQQQFRESRSLMRLMGRAGLPADVGRYNALILWYKKNKQWGEALTVLSEMKVACAKPSIVTFNSVIDACGKARQLKIAFELLDQVQQEGLAADTVTFTSLIDACGKAQQLERALALLQQMKSVGVRPNSFTYNALIDACAKVAEMDRAFQVLNLMLQEGIPPNTTTYTALIDACGKSQQLERAFHVLKRMQNENIKPNTATYTCLVDACGKAQQLERAFEVLRLMQEARVHANTHTYNALIDACGKARQLERAFSVLHEMQRAGVRPDAVSYTCLIDACGRSLKIERAMEVVQQMQQNGLRPNTAAFTSLIDACGKALEVERAFRVMQYMGDIGVPPNTATFTSLIDACGRAQQIEQAFAVFDQMQHMGVSPNAATFTTLINACAKCSELERAIVVLQQMSAANVSPDTITYTALINACSRTQQLERAFELLSQMKQNGLRPNAVTYNAIIDVCCKCGDLPRAEAAMAQMRTEGNQPDAITFNMLINTCCKTSQHERLFSILTLMSEMGVLPNSVTTTTLATGYTGDRGRLELLMLSLRGFS